MPGVLNKITRPVFTGVAVVLLVALVAQFLTRDLDTAFDNLATDLLFRLRGERQPAAELLFVYIGDADVEAIGEWPITRDYFGYLTHVLQQLDARAIAFDLLFDQPGSRYPEYDRIFADFIETSERVCLAATATSLAPAATGSNTPSLPVAESVVLPLPRFQRHATIGFSNTGTAAVARRLPLVASHNDSLLLSLGAAGARRALGLDGPLTYAASRLRLSSQDGRQQRQVTTDRRGRLWLNHAGGAPVFDAISLVDLLHQYEAQPDSLAIAGKLVFVGTASSALPALRKTPLANALPATLLHATVAENLIAGIELRPAPLALQLALTTLLALAPLLLAAAGTRTLALSTGGFTLLLFITTAFFCFTRLHLVLPLAMPLLAFAASSAWLLIAGLRHWRAQQSRETRRLQADISTSQQHLGTLQQRLQEIEQALQSEQVEKSALLAERTRLQTEHRQAQRSLAQLQRDQQVFTPAAATVPSSKLVFAPGSPLAQVLQFAHKVAGDTIPVLITGETGTGKELIARTIHDRSPRRHRPFVAVNCGALAEQLLESELFGHEKGSFTGAVAQRRGRFELADGGTIFLDEISETTPAFQARLLRVLQEGAFERLGGERTHHVDVRLVAATNIDLTEAVANGRFRADLYYRLNGFPIALPSLRERRADIPVLAQHFLDKHGYRTMRFSEQAMVELQDYHWPGNVRELENLVRRAALLAQADGRELIRAVDLPEDLHATPAAAIETSGFVPPENQILQSLRSLQFSRASISRTAKITGNRDRGTVTEYLRGLCFQALAETGFDLDAAAREIAGSDDARVVARVAGKMREYLRNVAAAVDANNAGARASLYKGLPQRFHPYLDQVIRNLHQLSE